MPECQSTQDEALARLKSSKPEKSLIVLAGNQTHGKGQTGNQWQVEPNTNLTFSLVKKWNGFLVENQFFLSQAIALSIYEVVKSLTELPLFVKWPNDILLNQKKIAGILVSNTLMGNSLEYSVIGIGLNVNQKHFSELRQAGSLFSITGKSYELTVILEQIVQKLAFYFLLIEKGDFETIKKGYLAVLFGYLEWRNYKLPDGNMFPGKIFDVDVSGKLWLETAETKQAFELKELSFIY